MKDLSDENIKKQLQFGFTIALGLDRLAQHENKSSEVMAVIAFILTELGFSEIDSYSSVAFLSMTGSLDLINADQTINTLPSLVCLAADMIRDKKVPDAVKRSVAATIQN